MLHPCSNTLFRSIWNVGKIIPENVARDCAVMERTAWVEGPRQTRSQHILGTEGKEDGVVGEQKARTVETGENKEAGAR